MVRSALAAIALLAFVLAGPAGGSSAAGPLSTPPRPGGTGAVPVATGLDFPGAFTFAPNGRIFWATTFGGEVHIYDPASGTDSDFITFSGTEQNQGILGVVLAPTYPVKPFVWVYITRNVLGLPKDQIIRVKDVGGTGVQPRVIYQANAGTEHQGGRMLFGSDGMLYVGTGEEGDPANSQDLTNTLGKMLRMTPSGGIPPGNPFANLIWSYGLRNSFGWDFDAQTGSIWEEDNGPECNDEINLIRKGRNYGWGPSETCDTPPPPPKNTNQDGPSP